MSERHVFVADVHLTRREMPKREALVRLIDGLARPGVRLYLLGDIFDVWIGAVQLEAEPETLSVIDAMARFVQAGGALTFFHGNRDFYMGRFLTRRVGAETVRGGKLVTLDGRRAWLSHGEMLCTSDHLYYFVGSLLRTPFFTALFHALPADMRYGASRTYRDISLRVRPRGQGARHGVSREAVRRLMRRGVEIVICGHVHEPSDRVVRWRGREARVIVLPPWTDRGWALEYSGGAFALKPVDYS